MSKLFHDEKTLKYIKNYFNFQYLFRRFFKNKCSWTFTFLESSCKIFEKIRFIMFKKFKVFYSLLRKLLWNITNLQYEVVTGREADQHDQQRMILLELCHLPAVVARVVQTAKHYTQRRSLQRRHWKPSYNGTAAYDSVWTLPRDGCCCSCSTGTEQNPTHKDDPRKDDF